MKTGVNLNLKFILLPVVLPLLLATSYLLPTSALAADDTVVYPGSSTITGNATSAGWTDNHMIGQTFVVPAGVGKISRVRLTNFKLGCGGSPVCAGANRGGIVSVALFAGAPGVSDQCWNRGLGGNECTKVISPPGARLAKAEKVYIGDEKVPNKFNSLCGWNGRSYPDNNVLTYLLKRMRIDSNNPCPKKSELQRMWNLFGAKGWGDLQGEWRNGGDSCGGCDGWWYPWELPDNYGGSDFLWPDFQQKSDVGSGLTYFEGSGWTTQSATWQGTDSPDNYLDVTLPTHTVIPGQTYFLSIQQSHTNVNNDPDRNTFNTTTDEYYEDGQYNCENPNEAINSDEPGYITIPGATSMESYFCKKDDNVFVVGIDNNNPYTSGQSYFNTVYYPGGPGDVANLTIWGAPPAPTNPRATCNASGTATFSWDNVSTADRYFLRLNNVSDSYWLGLNDIFVNTKGPGYACSGSSCSFTSGANDSLPNLDISFCANPSASGTCSTFTDGPSNIVLGQPYSWSIQSVGAGGATDITSCGPSRTCDYSLTCAAPPPPPSAAPSCISPANGSTLSTDTDPSNLTFTWGTVANGTSYSFKLEYRGVASDDWPDLVNVSGIAPTSGETSYTVTTIDPYSMNNLRWQVWASNAGGDGPASTCTFSLPQPSLFVLNSTPVTASGAVDAGPDTTSGLRSDDPNLSTGTTGKNYRNAANFNLSLLNAGIYNTLLQGVAFAGSSPLPNYGVGALYDLTRSANATNGFVIVYNPSNSATTELYYDPTWTPPFRIGPPPAGPVWTFNEKTYHVYYQGKWNNGDPNFSSGYRPLNKETYNSSNSGLSVYMSPSDTLDINNPVFEVTFWKPLGSRTWGTYGYLKQRYYQAASDQYFSLVYASRGI